MLWPLPHNSDCELHPLDSEFFPELPTWDPSGVGERTSVLAAQPGATIGWQPSPLALSWVKTMLSWSCFPARKKNYH